MFASKKIGVWGFGIVGKSVLNFLKNKNLELSLLEKRKLTNDELNFLSENKIHFLDQNLHVDKFLENNDFIIPSPGIDLRNYKSYQDKFISELDLFSQNFKKPIISVTGTIAKTTISHLIAQILKNKNTNAIAAGNIGIGMCDLIAKQHSIDSVVLEVSSFQLEHCKIFSGDLAIWSNFLPNHLDRHDDLNSYFQAKFKIISNQKKDQKNLINFSLINEIYKYKFDDRIFNFFCEKRPENRELKLLLNSDSLFFIENEEIIKYHQNNFEKIINLKNLPKITFIENWLIICSALYLLGHELTFINSNLSVPEHRLEKFASFDEIEFFNDSKSTVPDSTIAAVSNFKNRNVILFLGGLSKGIDRSKLIKELKNKVKFIICFGNEAEQLNYFCKKENINSIECKDLNVAIEKCFEIMQSKEVVLFSPAGSSYDLFTNYIERGNVFKDLVLQKISNLAKIKKVEVNLNS